MLIVLDTPPIPLIPPVPRARTKIYVSSGTKDRSESEASSAPHDTANTQPGATNTPPASWSLRLLRRTHSQPAAPRAEVEASTIQPIKPHAAFGLRESTAACLLTLCCKPTCESYIVRNRQVTTKSTNEVRGIPATPRGYYPIIESRHVHMGTALS